MNRAQRFVLILYCLLVVGCCTWVPWHYPQTSNHQDEYRWNYGWLWLGPKDPYYDPNPASYAPKVSPYDRLASPNLPIIALELLAATALAGAAMAATRS
jgi:hypothetical protein